MQTRTLTSVLWEKFLKTIEVATWAEIFKFSASLFCWAVISLSIMYSKGVYANMVYLAKYHDFAILKVSFVFVLVFFARDIFRGVKKVYSYIAENIPTFEIPRAEVHGPIYEGIPVIELVDYIFTAPTYSRADFCEHFGVGRKVFDDLATGLDNIKVFVRGQNNARTLSSEFSRADISSILTRAAETWEIRPLIRMVEKGYSHKPSMREIVDRSIPSPSHNFTTCPLHSSNPLSV